MEQVCLSMEVPVFSLARKDMIKSYKILVEFKPPSSPIVFRSKKRSRTFAGNSFFIPTSRGDVYLEPSQTVKKNGSAEAGGLLSAATPC